MSSRAAARRTRTIVAANRLLTREDLLRQAVIEQLYCDAAIDKTRIEQNFAIEFDVYFADELARLKELQDDGLVDSDDTRIRLTHPLGRLLLRVVAAVFDAYLPREADRDLVNGDCRP